MDKKCILFDLDGTLTDSGAGILSCACATLLHYGITPPEREEMRSMVGPPLRQSFARFGIDPAQIDEAVVYYRRLYEERGKYQNVPYPGIPTLLERLRSDGHRLFVATSKPEHMAVDILEHFDLARYFERICGALLDGVRDKKAAVIEYLLQSIGGAENAVMIGDTVYDVLGAAEHGIPTIAVAWGYGSTEEMTAAGAEAIVDTAEELYDLLIK